MGYLLLLLATLSWSFVGILVKAASTMVDSTTITFARFAFGILFLGIFLLIRDRKLHLTLNMKWIWIGAIAKSGNYFFENMAISIGYSYGNILVVPVQTIILLIISVLFFRERVSRRGWISVACCLSGIVLISWNGLPLSALLQEGAVTTVLFCISAIGAAFHFLSQKMLTKTMESGSMNFSTFTISTAILTIPLPFRFHVTGHPAFWPIAALIILGLITGLSFYWFSQALRLIPFSVAIIVSNCGVLFTILWARIFYHDPITSYIIGGALLLVAGLVMLNWPARQKNAALNAKSA